VSKYALDISAAARRDLKRLPLEIQRDIVFIHLPEIQEDPYKAGEPERRA
jgi:mRNA-degrading endonuclease RelE of RelBE toxin-antitoxin system